MIQISIFFITKYEKLYFDLDEFPNKFFPNKFFPKKFFPNKFFPNNYMVMVHA